MIYVGVDPGLDGSIAIINGTSIALHDCPVSAQVRSVKAGKKTLKFRLPDRAAMIAIVRPLAGSSAIAVVEKVQIDSRDNNSHVTAELLVRSAEAWTIALMSAGVEVVELFPAEWRRSIGYRGGSDKNQAIEEAIRLYPGAADRLMFKSSNGRWARKHGRAEALLMAHAARSVEASGNAAA